MKSRIISITLLFFSLILICISCSSNETAISKDNFRGVVLYPSDVRSLESDKLIDILKKAKINLIGLHSNTLTENLDSLKIFLEFAPIGRNYEDSLPSIQHNALKKNLEIFPKRTAHVLEYWLDASMFSGWDRNKWSQVPWNSNYYKRDVELYRSMGIRSFTTFATWMLHQHYFELYGQNETVEILKEYGFLLNRD